MARYAASTDVSSSRSREQIEKTIARYGANHYAYGYSDGYGMVGFQMNDRQVRFALPLPDRNAEEFHTTPTGRARSATAAEAMYEQAVKASWRALYLVILAKLEAVEAGIVTFDQEFLPHFVMPDGRTVAEHVIPAMERAYATGSVPPLLQITNSKE